MGSADRTGGSIRFIIWPGAILCVACIVYIAATTVYKMNGNITLILLLNATLYILCIFLGSMNKGNIATIFPGEEIMKYAEGVDKTLQHPLERATLTRGLGKNEKVANGDGGDDGDDGGKSRRDRNSDMNNSDDPIIDYRLGLNGRPEYIRAVLHKRYCSPRKRVCSAALKNKIQSRGKKGDHIGHILGHQFGGSMVEHNLFPQHPGLNMGHWRAVENRIKKWLEYSEENTIDLQARLIYEDPEFPMRPTAMHYLLKFYKNGVVATTDEVFESLNDGVEAVTVESLPNPSPEEKFTQNSRGDFL